MENKKWTLGIDHGKSSGNRLQMELLYKLLMTVADLNQNVQWISRLLTMQFPDFKRQSHCSEISDGPYTPTTEFDSKNGISDRDRNPWFARVQPNSHHQIVLQRMFERIVNQVNLETSNVLDNMFENSGISLSDHEQIRKQDLLKDKIRHLLSRLSNYDEKNFRIFVSSLKEYPDLAEEMKMELLAEKERNRAKTVCLSCTIRKRVDVRDVIDRLHSKGIVSKMIIDMILKGVSRNQIWNQIFDEMKLYDGVVDIFEIFCSTLEGKYDDIVDALRQQQSQLIPCSCYCSEECMPKDYKIIPTLITSDSGSLSDISSMSTDRRYRECKEKRSNEPSDGQIQANRNKAKTGTFPTSDIWSHKEPKTLNPQSRELFNDSTKLNRVRRKRQNQGQSLRVSPSYLENGTNNISLTKSPDDIEKKTMQDNNNTKRFDTTKTERKLPRARQHNERRRTDSSIVIKPLSYKSKQPSTMDSFSDSIAPVTKYNVSEGLKQYPGDFIRSVYENGNFSATYRSSDDPPRRNTDSDIYFNSSEAEQTHSFDRRESNNRGSLPEKLSDQGDPYKLYSGQRKASGFTTWKVQRSVNQIQEKGKTTSQANHSVNNSEDNFPLTNRPFESQRYTETTSNSNEIRTIPNPSNDNLVLPEKESKPRKRVTDIVHYFESL